MNINDFSNVEQWASQQWGQAELGDARRNQRAIQMGQALATNPNASLPEQMGSWGDLKAAYRLLGEEDVSHTALSQPHWKQTRKLASVTDAGVVLFIQDTSELDYTHHRKTENLGHIGDVLGKGMLLHTCLAVIPTPDNPLVLGLAHQKVWGRFEVKDKSETRTQRAAMSVDKEGQAQHHTSNSSLGETTQKACPSLSRLSLGANRRTESDVWAEIVEDIGEAVDGKNAPLWVSVGDRGSDVFS